jgi:hypothetical protein
VTSKRPALSIRQPWAELIISGKKSIEIRSWAPEYRGRLWVHTGLSHDHEIESLFTLTDLFRGGYLGSIRVSAIVPLDATRWETWRSRHLDPGPHKSGLYAWIVDLPIRFHSPIPAPGKINLFYPDSNLQNRLEEAETAAGTMRPSAE